MARTDRTAAAGQVARKTCAGGLRLRPMLMALLLGGLAASPVLAQSPAPAAGAPPASVAGSTQDVDPGALVNAALQVAGMVDAGQAGALWDGASQVAKKTVTRAAFVDGIAAKRKRYGAVGGRSWVAVRRLQSDGSTGVPAGTYLSVDLIAQVAGGGHARELVTLRLDEDGLLRLSGYVME